MRGGLWTIAAFGSQQVLRFGGNIVLTRLLVPEFFGLMALVNSMRIGLELFSDVGISHNIVHSPRGDDPKFLNTAWSLQIIRGVMLWMACWAIARPLADFYDSPQLVALVPVVCSTMLLAGMSSTKRYLLNRRMSLGKVTALELSQQLVSLVAMIAWAVFHPSVWALVAGSVAGGIYKLLSTHFLIPGRPDRLGWDSSAVREIVSFGKWVFIASIAMFLAEQTDRFFLGKLLSLETLGVFTIAFTLAEIPKRILKRIGTAVIFPLVSRRSQMPRQQLRQVFLAKRQFVLAGVMVLLLLLVGGGDVLVSFLYDDRYRAATWALPILALGAWLSALYCTSSPCLLGIGKPYYNALSNGARFIAILVGIPVGFHAFGQVGAIVAIALSDVPTYLTNQRGLWKEQLSTIRQDLAFTLMFAVLLALVLVLRFAWWGSLPIDALWVAA